MVYDVQKLFPDTEKFGLGSQLRRAVISVPSNLVEGNYRTSTKEQLHFIEMAFSSLMEVYCQLILAYDLKFISLERLKECKTKIDSVRKLLNGLRFKKLSPSKNFLNNLMLSFPTNPLILYSSYPPILARNLQYIPPSTKKTIINLKV